MPRAVNCSPSRTTGVVGVELVELVELGVGEGEDVAEAVAEGLGVTGFLGNQKGTVGADPAQTEDRRPVEGCVRVLARSVDCASGGSVWDRSHSRSSGELMERLGAPAVAAAGVPPFSGRGESSRGTVEGWGTPPGCDYLPTVAAALTGCALSSVLSATPAPAAASCSTVRGLVGVSRTAWTFRRPPRTSHSTS